MCDLRTPPQEFYFKNKLYICNSTLLMYNILMIIFSLVNLNTKMVRILHKQILIFSKNDL